MNLYSLVCLSGSNPGVGIGSAGVPWGCLSHSLDGAGLLSEGLRLSLRSSVISVRSSKKAFFNQDSVVVADLP